MFNIACEEPLSPKEGASLRYMMNPYRQMRSSSRAWPQLAANNVRPKARMLCRRAPAPKRGKTATQAAPAGPKPSKWGRCPLMPDACCCHIYTGLAWEAATSFCRRRFGFRLPWISGCWWFKVEAFGFRIPCRRWFKFQAPSRDRCFYIIYIHELDHGHFGELEQHVNHGCC